MKPIRIIRGALAGATLIAGVANCSDSNANPALTAPSEPLAVNTVNPNPNLPDAADLSFERGAADSVRAHYATTDSSDIGVTPWFPAGQGTLSLLGLRAGTSYNVVLEARRAETSVLGPSAPYNSPPLPPALMGVSMTLVSGTPPASGYTLTVMSGPDGHGYLLAFDGAGAIRWYRDCGPWDVQEAKQQTNVVRATSWPAINCFESARPAPSIRSCRDGPTGIMPTA